jgi:hypothetical protein
MNENVKLDEAGLEAAHRAFNSVYPWPIASTSSAEKVVRAYLAATKPPLADVTVKALFSQLYDWFNRLPGESLGKTHFDALIAIVTASPPMPGRGEGFVLVPVEAFTEKLNRLSAIITELAGEVKAGGPEDRAWAIINELLAASRPKEDTHAK